MDGDIACFWLLALDRNKNNNEVTVVSCQSYIVMSCHRFFLCSSYSTQSMCEPTV